MSLLNHTDTDLQKDSQRQKDILFALILALYFL